MDNLHKYIKIKGNFDFIKFATPIADLCSPIKGSPNQKYDNEYFLNCLIDFVTNSISWSKYKGTINYPN